MVVPSLPGFAFSGQPSRAGYGPKQMGEAVNMLMLQLGYSRYVAQGLPSYYSCSLPSRPACGHCNNATNPA